MYFVMKSFWKPATRGGRALPVHSVAPLVSKLPVGVGDADRDRLAGQVRRRRAQRDQAAVVHVPRARAGVAVGDLVAADAAQSLPSGLMLLLLRLNAATCRSARCT